MIDLEFVESLIRALDRSSLDSLELERGGTRIRLSKSPPMASVLDSGARPEPVAGSGTARGSAGNPTVEVPLPGEAEDPGLDAEEEAAVPDGLLQVISPMVGTFYRAPSPDASPYVEVGARVGKGNVLCIIEAMKLMNELESEVEGTVAKVLVEDAQPVEYGQVLFLIDPS